VLAREVVDQLLDEHRLAHAGAPEQADLAALDVRGDQVDALEPGLEDLDLGRKVLERRGVAVDRPAFGVGRERLAAVDRLTDHVPEAAEGRLPHGYGDRRAGVLHLDSARQAVRGVHRHGAHAVVAEVLLHLRHERPVLDLDLERGQDLRKSLREHGVDHDALDLDDPAGVVSVALCHGLSRAPRVRSGRWNRPEANGPKPARV
jgi:peptide chain release factor 1